SAYSLKLQSLTGPPRADLTIRITAKVAGCELPSSLTAVQVALLPFRGSAPRKVNVDNVPSPGGTATLHIGRVPRFRLVHATVAFGPQIVLAGQTKTLLMPDLVLTSVKAPKVSLSGRPIFVTANIRERTPDVGTTATVTVTAGTTGLATMPVAVRARRRVALKVPITFA